MKYATLSFLTFRCANAGSCYSDVFVFGGELVFFFYRFSYCFVFFFTLATICYLFFSGHIYVGVQKPCVSCPLLFSGFGNFFIMISLNRSSVSLAFVSASSMRIEFILNFCHLYVSQSSWMSFHLCIIFFFFNAWMNYFIDLGLHLQYFLFC